MSMTLTNYCKSILWYDFMEAFAQQTASW